MSSKVGFCLLNNFLFSIDSVRTSNTLRPCLNSTACIPVPSPAFCCLGLGSRPTVHGAWPQPSLRPPLRLLLTWPLHIPWTWFATCLGLMDGCYQLSALLTQLVRCSTAPCHWGHSLHFGCLWLPTRPPPPPHHHIAAPWQFPSTEITHRAWNSPIFYKLLKSG